MRIAIGSDHAGFELKIKIKEHLLKKGHEYTDVGTHDAASCDYPDSAVAACKKVSSGEADLGILICGTGIGMAMSANKVRGIRAANCFDPYCARLARDHNNANVLTLGGRILGPDLATEIVDAFIATGFSSGPRHLRRVEKIMSLEEIPPSEEMA
jgi:RpiB/LacA/LacB family sugar-phosphate isomerase